MHAIPPWLVRTQPRRRSESLSLLIIWRVTCTPEGLASYPRLTGVERLPERRAHKRLIRLGLVSV